MLHYYAKDFFAPVIVTSRLSEARELTIYVISDLHRNLKDLSVTLNIYKWGSQVPLSVQNFTNIAVVSIVIFLKNRFLKEKTLSILLKPLGCFQL